MGLAPVIALVFALIAASAAAFNGWIYHLRRSQEAHLWLALAAVGIAGMSVAIALLYGEADPTGALRDQQAMLACGALLIIAFPRFTCAYLGVERPGLIAFSRQVAIFSALLACVPGLYTTGEYTVRSAGVFGARYFAWDIGPVGIVYLAFVLGLFGSIIRLFWRNSERVEDDAGPLVAMLFLWFATALNDMAVGVGLYDGALLLAVGYSGFLMGFTAILTRRMAASLDVIERSARRMESLVERRTDELRERELQLAHGEQMATIGTLAAGVAHEINTPIAFVASSFSRLRELHRDDPESADVAEIFDECSVGVDRIRGIVADLSSLAHKSRDEHEVIQLHEVVESALPIVSHEARGRATIRNLHEVVPSVLGDRSQLGQVVLNLVMNALQAIPEGRPKENTVEVETRLHAGEVQLIVRDTGPGIPEEIRARVFDPFFTTKDDTGTGLGLAVTHQLVSRHRGRLEIESTPEGTTATVSLPAHGARSIAAPDSVDAGVGAA